MEKIKAYIDYKESTKTSYYKEFEIQESLPEIGDYNNGPRVIKINSVELDPEQGNPEVFDYSYYEVISKYEDEDDEEDNYYYDYIAIKYEN